MAKTPGNSQEDQPPSFDPEAVRSPSDEEFSAALEVVAAGFREPIGDDERRERMLGVAAALGAQVVVLYMDDPTKYVPGRNPAARSGEAGARGRTLREIVVGRFAVGLTQALRRWPGVEVYYGGESSPPNQTPRPTQRPGRILP